MEGQRIRHTVQFSLRHSKDSEQEARFLSESERILASIPGVENFEVLRQTSVKNEFDFAFFMEFSTQAAYDAYNGHPLHTDYVAQRWQLEVEKFMEADFVAAHSSRGAGQ